MFEFQDLHISSLNIEIDQNKNCREYFPLHFSYWKFSQIQPLTHSILTLKLVVCVELIWNFRVSIKLPKPAGFESYYLPILHVYSKITQNQTHIRYITLQISLYALELNQTLTCSKRALNIAVYTKLKLNVSEPDSCNVLVSKIFHCTLKYPKIKVVDLICFHNFRCRHFFKFSL